MKKILLSVLFIISSVTSVYATATTETGDQAAQPITLYGKQADGTVTALRVDSSGQLDLSNNISDDLSVANDLSVWGGLWLSSSGALRDNGGGDLEFTENAGSSWSDFGSGGSSFTNLAETGKDVIVSNDLSVGYDLSVGHDLTVGEGMFNVNKNAQFVGINNSGKLNPNGAALVVYPGTQSNTLWLANGSGSEIIFAGASADANIYQAWGGRPLYISTNSASLYLGYGQNQDDIEIGADYINMDNGTLYLDQTDNTVEIGGALTVDGGTLYVNSDANRVNMVNAQISSLLTVSGGSYLGSLEQLVLTTEGSDTRGYFEGVLRLNSDLTLGNVPVGSIADITNTTLSLSTSGNAYIGSDLTVIGVVNPVGGIYLSEDWPGDLSISNNLTVAGDIYGGVTTVSISGSYTASQMDIRGGVIYCDGKGVITLPAVVDGGSLVVLTVGTNGIQIDPNASDKIWLDGVALDDGDKINSLSASGNIAVLTYYSADGWYASTDSWTDGG